MRDVLVIYVYSGLVEGLLFVARAALLACVGELAFVVRVPSVASCYIFQLPAHAAP